MMNKNDSLDNKFNRQADKGDDSGRAERQRKSSARVIAYAEADPELQEKMDHLMSAIDRSPESFEAVSAFGTAPLENLGRVAKDILKIQSTFDEHVKTMDIKMDDINKGFAELGVENVVNAVTKFVKGAAGAAGATATGIGKFSKKMWDSLSGANKKRTEEEAHIQAMIDGLPEMYFKMQKLSQGLRGAEEGIKAVMKEAEKLGIARVETTRELNVYLGAAPEVLRRYDEIYIKEAKADVDDDGGPEAEMRLDNIIKAKENFQDQYLLLEQSRAQGLDAAQRLRMMMDQMEKQRKIILQSRTVRENEWLALLSTAGIAASSLKVGQMIKKADEAGNQVHDMTTGMMEKAHEMTLASQGRGTVDHKKLLESLERMQKMIDKEQEVKKERARELEVVRLQVRGAADRLLESVEVAKNARILEATPEKKEEKEKPVSNDNQAEPSATDAPRKNGTGPAPKP